MPAQRPHNFRLNHRHHLAQGLVYAGLGALAGGELFVDSGPYKLHSTSWTNSPNWEWSPEYGRFLVTGADGSDQYITRPANTQNGLADYSIAWIGRLDATADDYYGVIGASTFYQEYVAYRYLSGTVFVYIEPGTSAKTWANGAEFAGLGHHCITRSSDNTLKYYFNGIDRTSDGSSSSTETLGLDGFQYIGRLGTSDFMGGALGDILIYNRALSSSQIQQLADHCNVMLSGLIQPPVRRWWPVSGGGVGPAFAGTSKIIGGGIYC